MYRLEKRRDSAFFRYSCQQICYYRQPQQDNIDYVYQSVLIIGTVYWAKLILDNCFNRELNLLGKTSKNYQTGLVKEY